MGIYVGEGANLDEALLAVTTLADEAKISQSHAEIGRIREELTPQMNTVVEFMTGTNPENEWIGAIAHSTRHMWGNR
jgi:hypothetical protein